MTIRVVLRADATPAIGVGHVARSLALGAALTASGARVVLLAHAPSEATCARAARLGIPVEDIAGFPGSADDAREVLARGADVVVVDGYHFDTDYRAALARGRVLLVLVDDHATGPVDGAAIVVNQNAWAPLAAPQRGLLFGLDHALLGPAFLAGLSVPAPEFGRVLVTMGGADPDRLGPKLARAVLSAVGVGAVDLVIGAATPHIEEARRLAAKDPRVTLSIDLPHLASVMARATLGVVAAGGTLWEGLAAGLPMIAVDRDPVQARSVEALVERGLIVGRCRASTDTPACVAAVASEALASPRSLLTVSTAGRQAVDGQGAARVAEAILRRCAEAAA